jgi:predicted hydrocarbon binding protein
MRNKYNSKKSLLERSGRFINSIINGLEELSIEQRKKIMEKSGEECAIAGSYKIAKKISQKTNDIEEIIEKVNYQIPWCGKWKLEDNLIKSICNECGCPLIRNKIVNISSTFCYCSLGWIRMIFRTLLNKPVQVEMLKSIGAGDDVCEYVVYI